MHHKYKANFKPPLTTKTLHNTLHAQTSFYLQTWVTSQIQESFDHADVTFVDPYVQWCLSAFIACVKVSSPAL